MSFVDNMRQCASFAGTFLDMVFPRMCAGCGQSVGGESLHICWECLAGLWPVQFPHCSVCGNPVQGAVTNEYACALCSGRKRRFDRARSAVHYEGRIAGIIQAFKYGQAAHLARDLAGLLAVCARVHYASADVDTVTYVPLHHRKERERTYNQSHLLARELASMLRKPFLSRCLVRWRSTLTQTALSAAERRVNVKGAFRARNERWIEGRRILLVDDVMTTGATVDECADVLKQAGAARVRVITVARGC